jgi:hypothetical protein
MVAHRCKNRPKGYNCVKNITLIATKSKGDRKESLEPSFDIRGLLDIFSEDK